jgi:molybdopterin molybdotransferase
MMALSYAAGLEMVLDAARVNRKFRQTRWEVLYDVVGGIVAEDVASPKSSLEYDTSAMDGYAICSQVTADATPERPVMFTVQGTLAAGDDPTEVVKKVERDQAINNLHQCVEIMTGAIFPYAYDAYVKVEDAVLVESPEAKYILVTRPVPRNAHRRLARSDISEGDVMIRQGQVLQASYVLPLASVGIKSVPLTTSPRVAVWSTGKEIANGKGARGDADGPYLTAALKEMGL